jgi:FkbM family methyltransferase
MDKFNLINILSKIKNGVFIQIGSHDGVSNDEFGLKDKLLNENHTSVLIEPIPEHFNNLVTNYSKSKSTIFFENIAISDKKEIKKMCVNGQDSSFIRMTSNEFTDVSCDTLSNILKKYNITHIDGLFIDVEGYEYTILNSIFNDNISIGFIRYEFWWSTDKEKLDNLIIDNGFDVYQDEFSYADKIAIKK